MIKATARAFTRSIGPKRGEPFLLEHGQMASFQDQAAIIADPVSLGNMVANLVKEYGAEGLIINLTFASPEKRG